ncbi:DUF7359 domain-containing protein [Rossellomorea marisflavi]|uniref:DUF7359 domain-containing protein n=1 Tax=Rossellomorea marisflavi TaxID=189381 RepID=UPI003FA0D9FE
MFTAYRNSKPLNTRLYLTKNNKARTTIEELHHITPPTITGNFGKINELSFSIPYKTEIRHKLMKNPHIEKIKEKLFIKAVTGEQVEWFLINKINRSSSDTNIMDVQCFGLGYQLWYRKVIDYEATSINLFSVASDCLKNTGWKVGYINPDLNLKYRQFDVSSKRKLEFIYEIAETFDVIPVFDTVNKQIHFYKEEEVNQYKGFWLESGKYINSIESELDADQIVTRLHVKGGDNLKINLINPTGQSYIDDFSYLMFPFEMDEDGNVLRSSNLMSDELCIALVNYNKYLSSRKGEFKELLDLKKTIQEESTVQENKLTELKMELQLILDSIEAAEGTGGSKSSLIADRDNKNKEIEEENSVISGINNKMTDINARIEKLKIDLDISNFLNEELLEDLESNWIHEDEWSDENKIDENDLYEAGLKHISEINMPPINIKTNIINFFSMISEQHNWNRLNLGDIVRIKNKTLDIDIKATVTQMVIDHENNTIDITISNSKQSQATTYQDMVIKSHYTISKINTDYNNRKLDWKKMAQNFNLRNDRISEKPTNPILSAEKSSFSYIQNDNGSINLTINWEYPDFNSSNKNEDNIDGFFVYLKSNETPEKYQFGSQMAKESIITLDFNKRSYTFLGIAPNKYYTVGIRAYRYVDDDIESSGILMSDIVSPPYSTDDPFLPSTVVNLNGRVNGVKYTVKDIAPESPVVNDVWVNNTDAKTRVWDGKTWKVNNDLARANEYTDQLKEELEKGLIEGFEDVYKELDDIENEVIPKVRQVIIDTYAPRQPEPPEEVGSGLWWDTSVEPPRFKRYDDATGEWIPVAPTDEEVEAILRESPIDGNNIIAGTVTAKSVNANEVFANKAIVEVIQSGIVKTSELNAAQIVAGELDALKVRVKNLSASEIITGILKGIQIIGSVFKSGDGYSSFKVEGGYLELTQGNGSILLSPIGLYGFNPNGSAKFQVDSELVSSKVLGTTSKNVYIANREGEARVVDMDSVPGDGEASSYRYTDIRAAIAHVTAIDVNNVGGASNLYTRPLAGGELRVTSKGTTDMYQNLRANTLYAGALDHNGLQGGNHVYVRPPSGGEVRGTVTGTSTNYIPFHGSGFIGGYLQSDPNANIFLGTDGEIRLTSRGMGTVWRNLRGNVAYLNAIDSNDGENLYLRPPSSGVVKVTEKGTTDRYADLYYKTAYPQSQGASKTNIREWDSENLETLDILKGLNVRSYHYQSSVDNGNFYEPKIGMLAEELPAYFRNLEATGADPYSLVSFLVKTCQIQQNTIEALEKRVTDLENTVS